MNKNLEVEAKKAYQKKQYQKSAELFLETADFYSTENPEKEAEMRNNASVAFLQNNEPEKAFSIAEGTDVIFEKCNDIEKQAMALGNQAAALQGMKKSDEALEKYTRASEILKGHKDFEDTRSYILKQISALQIKQGDHLQSLVSMKTALDNKKKLSLRERFLKKLINKPFDQLSGQKKQKPE